MAKEKLHPALIKESKKTIDEAIQKLNDHGKVFVCRPTGFGKTYMLIQVAKFYNKLYPDKKIAYIYPLDIIPSEIKVKYGKNSDDSEVRAAVKNLEFISYMTLTRRINDNGNDYWLNHFKDGYSILLVDEVHAAGSIGFRKVYDSIKGIIGPEAGQLKMIGVTATPNRMDDEEDKSVLNDIFDNIQVYEYTLANCINDGIIDKLVIGTYKYNMKELAEQLRGETKAKAKKAGIKFNDESFNVELSKIIKENGTEAEFIYKYLALAGYDLSKQNEKYFKFIVFFNNIQDVAERGPMVEEWFDSAFNEVAKSELGLKRDFLIKAHYLTSSDTEDGLINALVEEDKKHRFKYDNTKKLTDAQMKDKYVVDLIMTVNMTNMGYHDDDITGIVMLRGTRSEIVYYQQLGRAISVTNEHSPLIYDFVNNVNTKFWSKKNRKIEIAGRVLGDTESDERTGEGIDYSKFVASTDGDYDAGDAFLNRWSDIYYSEKAQLEYLYNDRKAPLVAIAADTGKSCSYIAKALIDDGVTLRKEDDMYRYELKIAESKTRSKEERKNACALMKYLLSKGASDMYTRIRKTEETIYNKISKLIKGGK